MQRRSSRYRPPAFLLKQIIDFPRSQIPNL
nr:MAG TPA: hypothetical protein [Caudoviricetes sp.]